MLTFKFIPYDHIADKSTEQRLQIILDHVKEDEIVLLEGRLEPDEETKLIAKTMEAVDDDFSGIEISVLHKQDVAESWVEHVKGKLIDLLLGNSYGFTLIGSAEVIKEIEQDPEKVEFFAEDTSS